MSRKDFELIAGVFKGRTSDAAVTSLAVAMAKRLKEANPRFQPNRFLKACGVEDYDASWM